LHDTPSAGALAAQGKYLQAREAYEEALKIAERVGDLRGQGVKLGQLGTLALRQRDDDEAQARYAAALQLFQRLGEPESEAIIWHQLGMVAEEQHVWAEAERCYRESLAINEHLGNAVGAANTCNQLAVVAIGAGRPAEAEGWYMRTLELDAQTDPSGPGTASSLNNLADLLMNEVKAGRAATTRLADAKRYVKQALAIRETLDASSEIWTTMGILAKIADLEGRLEEARDYSRRAHEAFAAFAGNRYHIDQQHGPLIAAISAAAQGDARAREAVEAALPQLEELGWKITAASRRIWSGERDWHSLAEGLDEQVTLLILRVLEIIAQPAEAQGKTSEQINASLPASFSEALEQGDEAALQQAFEGLLPEDQQVVVEAMQRLQPQQEEEGDDEDEEPEIADVVQQFEPLLQAIAAVAVGVEDSALRAKIESDFETLEAKGWHLNEPVQRIWLGERDAISLTKDLDEQDSVLVQRMLEIIAEAGK
jgi:tetratricopeptide (TPR) repeat protein